MRTKVNDLDRLLARVRACRLCIDSPVGPPLPHAPRPVVVVEPTARILICGQAPGTRVHASGRPFDDPSGVRLRAWMGVSADEFYDARRIAFVPMGFCFPGQTPTGADLPPRRECAAAWRAQLLRHLPNVALVLLIGRYAQSWHLGTHDGSSLTETVSRWRELMAANTGPVQIPLPHPSWRNTSWIKKNPWFERELLPVLQREVRRNLT
jgi:uracil-DNA glycosylase